MNPKYYCKAEKPRDWQCMLTFTVSQPDDISELQYNPHIIKLRKYNLTSYELGINTTKVSKLTASDQRILKISNIHTTQ